jgi:hypothetical protein
VRPVYLPDGELLMREGSTMCFKTHGSLPINWPGVGGFATLPTRVVCGVEGTGVEGTRFVAEGEAVIVEHC